MQYIYIKRFIKQYMKNYTKQQIIDEINTYYRNNEIQKNDYYKLIDWINKGDNA